MSKIQIHHSLAVARKVIKELEAIIPKGIAKNCRVESWSNGREQGLCLSYLKFDPNIFSKKFCIAEHRSSDNILVIHGTAHDFDNHNQPTDEIWKTNSTHFKYDQFRLAANHILGKMHE